MCAALHAKEDDLHKIGTHRGREAEILAELHGPDDWAGTVQGLGFSV